MTDLILGLFVLIWWAALAVALICLPFWLLGVIFS